MKRDAKMANNKLRNETLRRDAIMQLLQTSIVRQRRKAMCNRCRRVLVLFTQWRVHNGGNSAALATAAERINLRLMGMLYRDFQRLRHDAMGLKQQTTCGVGA